LITSETLEKVLSELVEECSGDKANVITRVEAMPKGRNDKSGILTDVGLGRAGPNLVLSVEPEVHIVLEPHLGRGIPQFQLLLQSVVQF
jgi:hypothetical protein